MHYLFHVPYKWNFASTSFSSQIGRSGWEVSLLHFPSFPAVTWRLREKSGQKRYPYLDMSLTHACNLGWLPYMFVVLACGEPTYMIVLISFHLHHLSQGLAFAKEHALVFMETSAKTAANVEEVNVHVYSQLIV